LRNWWKIWLALAVALPSIALRAGGVHLPAVPGMVVFGGSVVAAAFILVWAAEAAHRDISGSLATAILAVIAVLPEYAVDLYFGWSSGHNPEHAHYAAANMTGGNRLLLGLGWPFVVLLFVVGARRRGVKADGIQLLPPRRLELAFLGAASLYSLVIPFTRRLAWYDAVVLLVLFALYLWRAAHGARSEPHLLGMAKELGDLPMRRRRVAVVTLLLASSVLIIAAAEPFAESLLSAGGELGIDEFLLVQWFAPLASEAPELLVAAMLAFRGEQDSALGTLLSAKVNQWTLLVGSLPLAHRLGGGTWGGIVLDARQTEEFILTSAQTLLGFAVLLDLRMRNWEALALFALFALQFPFPQREVRLGFAAVYAGLAVLLLIRKRAELRALARSAR
jgi:cation:H+ antiporter